jgi:hypothetical protein
MMAITSELSCSYTTFWYAIVFTHAERVGYIRELKKKNLLDMHQESSFVVLSGCCL